VQFNRVNRRKTRIAQAAEARLNSQVGDEPITSAEITRLLTRIARTAKTGDRLRAIEMLIASMVEGQWGLHADRVSSLTDDERADGITALLDRARARRELTLVRCCRASRMMVRQTDWLMSIIRAARLRATARWPSPIVSARSPRR
jgi:hypothetical protein